MLRNSANNSIIMEKISFAGVLIRKFLVGHRLAGIVSKRSYVDRIPFLNHSLIKMVLLSTSISLLLNKIISCA